jgi:hypothetical protein
MVAALILCAATGARAHLLPPQHATVNVVGESAFVVASVPVSALHGFDDDRDGLLDAGELTRHRSELQAELSRRFSVTDGGQPGTVLALDLFFEPRDGDGTRRADQLLVLEHVRFARPPRRLSISTDLFGSGPRENTLEILATRNSKRESEKAVLAPGRAEHAFFAGFELESGSGLIALIAALALAALIAGSMTPRAKASTVLQACQPNVAATGK